MTDADPFEQPERFLAETSVSPIVSPREILNARDRSSAFRFIDATWTFPGGPSPKVEGRIPGATSFDIDKICDASSALPHMLPTADVFARAVEALGVSNADDIVIYDRIGVFSAPRVWWTFKVFGHERVRVLDGGLPAWIEAGGGYETEPALAAASVRGVYQARLNAARVADADAVASALSSGSARVLDARPAARFGGEAEEPRAGLRSGHMPGAQNLPLSTLVGADGRFVDRYRLKGALMNAGALTGEPVIGTCGSGVTACVIALVAEALGHPAAVYDGAWAEWGGDPKRSVATGST